MASQTMAEQFSDLWEMLSDPDRDFQDRKEIQEMRKIILTRESRMIHLDKNGHTVGVEFRDGSVFGEKL